MLVTIHSNMLNFTLTPWSHIWLMLIKFAIIPSTINTSLMQGKPGLTSLHMPLILPFFSITKSNIEIWVGFQFFKIYISFSHVLGTPTIKIPILSWGNSKGCMCYKTCDSFLGFPILLFLSFLPFLSFESWLRISIQFVAKRSYMAISSEVVTPPRWFLVPLLWKDTCWAWCWDMWSFIKNSVFFSGSTTFLVGI